MSKRYLVQTPESIYRSPQGESEIFEAICESEESSESLEIAETPKIKNGTESNSFESKVGH
jgi:hypothetical protein